MVWCCFFCCFPLALDRSSVIIVSWYLGCLTNFFFPVFPYSSLSGSFFRAELLFSVCYGEVCIPHSHSSPCWDRWCTLRKDCNHPRTDFWDKLRSVWGTIWLWISGVFPSGIVPWKQSSWWVFPRRLQSNNR